MKFGFFLSRHPLPDQYRLPVVVGATERHVYSHGGRIAERNATRRLEAPRVSSRKFLCGVRCARAESAAPVRFLDLD